MKKYFFILFSFPFLLAISQSVFIGEKQTLNNGECFIAPDYDYSDTVFNYYYNKENEIAESFIKKFHQSPLISSLVEDEEMLKCFDDAIKYNCDRAYNDSRFYPVIHQLRYWRFNSLLHELIKIKMVRDYAAKLVKDVLVELCKLYPQDFREIYIEDLTDLLSFIKAIPKHKYTMKVNKRNKNEPLLYVDGKYDFDLSIGYEGFILRRYLIDEIPLKDLENYVKDVLNAIKAIDVSSNPEYMYVADINQHFKYYISSEGRFIEFANNKKELSLDYYGDYRIVCRSDSLEAIYTMENGFINKEKKWVTHKNKLGEDIFRVIFNSKGTILVESRNE